MTSLSSANENSMNYASLAFAKSTKILVEEDLSETLLKGTIHKGRLLKGVGRWVHQKEIY